MQNEELLNTIAILRQIVGKYNVTHKEWQAIENATCWLNETAQYKKRYEILYDSLWVAAEDRFVNSELNTEETDWKFYAYVYVNSCLDRGTRIWEESRSDEQNKSSET